MKTRKIVKIVSIVGIVIAVGFGAVAIAASARRDSEKGFGRWMVSYRPGAATTTRI